MKQKKIFICCLAFSLMIMNLSGCSSKNEESLDSLVSSETEYADEKLPETESEWRKAMMLTSLYSYGNTAKIQEKIKKAQSGENVTVAYLGGSITEGLTAGADSCYAKLSCDYFSEKFGDGDNVKYCNAGLSGTPSTLGILRLERDVLDYNPDICFVEFAVNDGSDGEYQNAYESIVRELIENDVAVILLFSVTKSDYSAQDYMKSIGNYYDLPMISYADALRMMFENDQMTWEDFSDDESHPNVYGHQLVADMIGFYFDTVSDFTATDYNYPKEPIFSARGVGSHLFESYNLTPTSLGSWIEGTDISRFKDGWKYVCDGDNEPIKFEFTAKFVSLIYKEVKQGDWGSAHIKVTCDGELYDEFDLDPKSASGWGNPQIVNIGMQTENVKYEIEISMAEGSEANNMQILGFGYTIDE